MLCTLLSNNTLCMIKNRIGMFTGNMIFTQQIPQTLEIFSQLKICHNDLKITLVLIFQFRKNISIMYVK